MAEVFKAKAIGVEGFEKLVAIKRILPNIAEDEEFITMFIDEAKIAVQLNHANIAQIFDLGKIDDSYFIALEYVHGKDLRSIFERLRKRGEIMPIASACYSLIQGCEGLEYAHRKKDGMGRDLNIVHRDVSPQNILISYDGDVKIIDFGIAKAANKASKTQAGILKGKFGYMSPEQVRGLPLDRRSDVFSVGIILYELITGERLFVGESDFSTLEKVRNVEIMPPTTYNRKIPEPLEKIVLKGLTKDADDRYQYAAELSEDLQRFMVQSGMIYTRRDLGNFMKTLFADEVARDAQRIDEFKAGPSAKPGLVSVPPAAAPRTSTPAAPARDKPPVQWPEAKKPAAGPIVVSTAESIESPTTQDQATMVFGQGSGLELATNESTRPVGTPIGRMSQQRPATSPRTREMKARSGEIAAVPRTEVAFVGRYRAPLVIGVAAAAVIVVAAVIAMFVFGGPSTGSAGPGTLVVNAVPADAEIGIDGATVSKASPYNNKAISAGRHELAIQRDGYKPFKEIVEIKAGEVVNKIVSLEEKLKIYGNLVIETIPGGAVVTIDGRVLANTTPLKFDKLLAEVDHTIVVEKTGLKPFTQKIRVKENETKALKIPLGTNKAKLIVNSMPPGAQVYLNNEKKGTAPVEIPDLDPSKEYALRLLKAGFDEKEMTVKFESTDDQTVSIKLAKAGPAPEKPDKPDRQRPDRPPDKPDRPKPDKPDKVATGGNGFLNVNSTPWSYVIIDGKDTGKTTPLIRFNVPAGAHWVTLRTKDGKEKTQKVTIKAGETILIKEPFN